GLNVFRARWVLPVAGPPVRDGWVSVEDGRVAAVGEGRAPGAEIDLGEVALIPGLVNAHTHIELSWMAGLVPPAVSMDGWIRKLLEVRRAGPVAGEPEVAAAMVRALRQVRETGTVLLGDISNTLASVPVLQASACDAAVFHEILGFNAADPLAMVRDAWKKRPLRSSSRAAEETTSEVVFAVVAHAPYSTSPALFAEIAAHHQGPAPLSVHLAESVEEIEFLRTGRGPIREMLNALGVWDGSWEIPRCGPVEYLRRIGYLKAGALLVHCVHLTVAELDEVRDAGAVVVTCPRSNVWVGGGLPPVSRFYGAGVPVAVGTDSLASTGTLNMFDELAALRRLAPEVDAARLLDSATRVGAEALGFGQHYGTISKGRWARFASVALPPGIGSGGADVEEYLVSGVPAAAIGRVDAPAA
ncbi:MAG TPA: amidohydrolase family protein, partial [Vicinamibacterales bacterium]|nr:amidohydrolase family protein [Vicinamibacterales bacterium]